MKVLNGKILIEMSNEEQTSSGGLILKTVEREKTCKATVVQTCEEYFDEKTGKLKKSNVNVGDTIFVHKGVGEEIKLEGNTYRMIHEIDVFAKLVIE